MGQYIGGDVLSTLNKPKAIELTAGQATLHSFDCVHASSPNGSDSPRVGLALRYMAAHVLQTKPVREMATWICGDFSTHFDMEPRLPDDPTKSDIERGREAQKEALAREERNYYA